MHQNPKEAGMVKNLVDWPYSSYLDYIGIRNGTLCNKEFLFSITGITMEDIQNRTSNDLSVSIKEKFY